MTIALMRQEEDATPLSVDENVDKRENRVERLWKVCGLLSPFGIPALMIVFGFMSLFIGVTTIAFEYTNR